MKTHSPVLLKLAELYERSAAGRHGSGKIDFQPECETLLRVAGCAEGEARELAERELREAETANIIQLQYDRPRARSTILKVRVAPAKEQALFTHIGRRSPMQRRAEWSLLFREAESWEVPPQYAESWRQFCTQRASAARHWYHMKPFQSQELETGRETLTVLTRLLAWKGRHLVRWVSSILCADSKLLERRQQILEALLAEATGGVVPTYDSLGILSVPPSVTLHGPLRLRIGDEWCDLRALQGPTALSGADVSRITALECDAQRCLTVENATPFRSLVTSRSGEMLIQTSYPSEATLALLARLAEHQPEIEFWHFGDTDPKGFHILLDLRTRTGLPFRSFHMRFRPAAEARRLDRHERELVLDLLARMPVERRSLEAMLADGGRGDFEQESLKPPPLSHWPFYPDVDDRL
jgi:hypothetical protein